MSIIRKKNQQIKQDLEALIFQHKQQHLCHQDKMRHKVIAQYLQFNASLSALERAYITQFVDQYRTPSSPLKTQEEQAYH